MSVVCWVVTMSVLLDLTSGSTDAPDWTLFPTLADTPTISSDTYIVQDPSLMTSKNFNFSFDPPEVDNLQIMSMRRVHINCSSYILDMVNSSIGLTSESPGMTTPSQSGYMQNNFTFLITVVSDNEKVAVPTKYTGAREEFRLSTTNQTQQVDFLLNASMEGSFYVYAINIGRSSMLIRVSGPIISGMLKVSDNWTSDVQSSALDMPSDVLLHYKVTVVRRERGVDLAFRYVIAGSSLMFSFSMGCVTDLPSLKTHFKAPAIILVSLIVQFGLMPLVAVAVALAFQLGRNESLGLFFTACVQGGGGGHVLVSMNRGNRSLSIALNFVSSLLVVGTGPMWIFVMGPLLGWTESELSSVLKFVIWLTASVIIMLLGIALRHVRVRVAEELLNWFIKPYLLLFVILFITIGMYTNIYMVGLCSTNCLLAAGSIPLLGYLFGAIGAQMFKQEHVSLKTIATETTVSNCLLVIAMIRFTLKQPDADISAMMPVWVLYAIPIPLIVCSMFFKIRDFIIRRLEKRKEKTYRNFSIVSSLLNMTNVTTLSAGTSPRMNSPSDDSTTLIDQKVTVV